MSEQMTEAEPSVSTDDRFLTMALCLARRCTPMASTSDKMAGRPSGTAATASATPSNKTSTTSDALWTSEIIKMVPTTTTAMTTTAMPSMRPTAATSFCRGVGFSAVDSSRCAMAPICVFMPVAVTTARPVPWATAVPLKTMLRWSPRDAGPCKVATSFSTASLSPVSEASCTRRVEARTSRASAPTVSPSPSTSRSPCTSSALGTRRSCPSRTTADVTAVMRASAATASWALDCCTKPKMPLRVTTAEMTRASTGQPLRPSISHAASAMAIAASNR